MVDPIDIRVTDRVSGNIAKKLDAIGTAARSSHNAVELLKTSLREFRAVREISEASSSTRTLTRDLQGANRAARELNNTVRTTGTAFGTASTRANQYANSLTRANAATNQLGRATQTLGGYINTAVGIFGGIFAVQQYAQAQDALTSIQNRLRTITSSAQELASIQDTLFDLADRTRSGVEATVEAYTRYTNILRPIGISQQEILRFTETLNKGLVVAGTSAAEAQGSIRQFTQALQSGVLRGEEFNSVMEQFPIQLVQAIADEMGVTTGELRALAEQGEITREVLLSAFANVAPTIDELFNRTVPTIGNAITQLRNDFILFTEDSAGAAGMVAQAIYFLGDNLETIIPLVVAFAGAWAAVKVFSVVTALVQLTGALVALAPVLIAHPILLLAASLAAAALAVLHITGNLEGFLGIVGEAVGGVLGFNTATDGAAAALDKTGVSANTTVGEINRFGTETTPAIVGTTDAAGNLSTAIATVGEQSPAITAITEETVTLRAEIDETESSTWNLVDALKAAWEWIKEMSGVTLGDILGGGGSGEGEGGNAPASGGGNGGGGDEPGFATGGSFMVGGRSGIDKNRVSFRATRGERVDVLTPAQQRAQLDALRTQGNVYGGNSINMTIITPNADSFRRSKHQIVTDLNNALAVG